MNYRTIQDREGELLLSKSKEKAENDPRDISTESDVSKTLITKRQSAKEKLVNNADALDTTLSESRLSERYIDRETEQIVSDTNGNTADRKLHSSSSDWVSFDESNNSEYLSDVIAPKQTSTTLLDNTDPGTPPGEDSWIKFENTKESNGRAKDDTLEFNPKQGTGETHEFDGNTRSQDVSTNPFNNSELERISPFSKGSKGVNGVSSEPIRPPSLQETAVAVKEPPIAKEHTAINRNVEKSAITAETNENGENSPLPTYPSKPTNTTWSMLLRYPDTKQRLRGRDWRPVVIKLHGSILQVYDEHDTTAPFREVSLQYFYDLTKPTLQQYMGSKVHTIKLLYVKYKETQKLLSKKNVQYIARNTPILKLASSSHSVIREFIEVVRHAIRSLPIFRDRGISHNTEAVYINVHDTCSALIDSSGSVLMLGILVRIFLRAFISGDAECELVLNDIHMKSKEEARLRQELMPQRVHKWIKLEQCDFHSTVNSSTYSQNQCILLHPIDSCTFEVMQFRVRPVKPLPLLAKCELITDNHGRVELRAEVKLCSDPKLARYERKNICLYFPIPEAWVQFFMKEKRFRGEQSITSTSSQKAIKMRNRKNRPLSTIDVSTGSAMYESEYKSVVWRINQLPLLNTTAPADSTHDFTCHIQTMDSLPDDYKPQCMMEYEIPYTVASDTNVVNFKVLDKKIATREVSYHTYYTYEIQMNMTSLNGGLRYDR